MSNGRSNSIRKPIQYQVDDDKPKKKTIAFSQGKKTRMLK